MYRIVFLLFDIFFYIHLRLDMYLSVYDNLQSKVSSCYDGHDILRGSLTFFLLSASAMWQLRLDLIFYIYFALYLAKVSLFCAEISNVSDWKPHVEFFYIYNNLRTKDSSWYKHRDYSEVAQIRCKKIRSCGVFIYLQMCNNIRFMSDVNTKICFLCPSKHTCRDGG